MVWAEETLDEIVKVLRRCHPIVWEACQRPLPQNGDEKEKDRHTRR
jgi:hypothetical protein